VPLIARGGFVLTNVSQCFAPDQEEDRGRCRLVATHLHRRRRDGDKGTTVVALCKTHYELAGPEMAVRS
jgi:hypothetical protein